ncbi:hypothetical protein SRABI26_00475 [Arthrobacter sp. Bi26]|nr:hypothetical protein SRABI26_00475 [Arthrobacter sp. Bi26]
MAEVRVHTHLSAGRWHDLEVFTIKAPNTVAEFEVPAGVQIKLRYGAGPLGYDRQQQTTDGRNVKRLVVGGLMVRARMQARTPQAIQLSYKRITK